MDLELLLPLTAQHRRGFVGEPEAEQIIERLFAAPAIDARQIPHHCVCRPESGERRLALAVFADGLVCAIRHVDSRLRDQASAARSALDWIESASQSHFYAFERLCQLFAIDADWLRGRVQREIERRRQHSEAA